LKLETNEVGRKFWHQLLRSDLTAVSGFVTQDILGLPKPSLIERYTNIFVVFTVSGILHVTQDIGMNVSDTYLGTMMFFQSFALGIMIEDGVQHLFKPKSKSGKKVQENVKPAFWKKLVGYVWVILFMSVVSPWFTYRQAAVPTTQRWLVPVEITSKIGPTISGLTLLVGAIFNLVYLKAEI
jgi:Membrane bound O-acyl transferase family